MYKSLWYPSLKPFFYDIRVIDCFFFAIVVINATCRVRSCWRWFVNDDCSLRLKESFFSSFSFLRTSQEIDDLVVYNPPMLPTTLMMRLSEFIYQTLFLRLLQTTNNCKTLSPLVFLSWVLKLLKLQGKKRCRNKNLRSQIRIELATSLTNYANPWKKKGLVSWL